MKKDIVDILALLLLAQIVEPAAPESTEPAADYIVRLPAVTQNNQPQQERRPLEFVAPLSLQNYQYDPLAFLYASIPTPIQEEPAIIAGRVNNKPLSPLFDHHFQAPRMLSPVLPATISPSTEISEYISINDREGNILRDLGFIETLSLYKE